MGWFLYFFYMIERAYYRLCKKIFERNRRR